MRVIDGLSAAAALPAPRSWRLRGLSNIITVTQGLRRRIDLLGTGSTEIGALALVSRLPNLIQSLLLLIIFIFNILVNDI